MTTAPVADGDLAALEDRIAAVMGVLNSATAELVELIADADRTKAWEGWGIRSLEHWVTWRCGVSPERARRLVRLARALPALPMVAEAWSAGTLSEDQGAVVCRHTTPATDAQVAELAPLCTVTQLRRALPSIPQPAPPLVEEPVEERFPHPATEERRRVAFGYLDDGRWWLHALLPADEGAIVERALRASREHAFRDRHPDGDAAAVGSAAHAGERDAVTWCESLLHLAMGAMGGTTTRPDRFQAVVHIDADGRTPGAMHLGPLLPAGIDRLVTCDADVVAVIERSGRPVRLGRRRRTVPQWLRTVIEHRDGGCRVPACGRRRWLHVHHLVHWRDGGPTDPDNLVALCSTHHRLLHLGKLRISGDPDDPDGLTFTDDQGRALAPAQAAPPTSPPAQAAADLGLSPDRYRSPIGEPLHGWAITWN